MSFRSAVRSVIRGKKSQLEARRLYSISHEVSSPVEDIKLPNLFLHEYVLNDIHKWHDKIAAECINSKRKYTYEEINRKSDSLAGFLQKCGIRKGDVVAVVLPNVPEYLISLLGISKSGSTVTTINPIYTSDEIQRQLVNSGTKLVITMTTLHPIVKDATDNVPNSNISIVTINHNESDSTPEGCVNFFEVCELNLEVKDPNLSLDDVVILPYSSGTTGLPKGVKITHRNLVSNIAQSNTQGLRYNTETTGNNQDIIPLVLPLFHIYGLSSIGFTKLSRGCKLVTVPKFNTDSFSKLLHQCSPNLLFAVPPMVLMLLNNPQLQLEKVSSLRSIISGAAPLGSEDICRLKEKTGGKVNLMQMYGLTECSPVTHKQSTDLKNGIKVGGSGFLLPNTKAKIVKIDDRDCVGLGPNESGELLIKGPQVMAGYLNNPEADKGIFVEGGWMRTGDIANYDEDNHFFITDRLKELIKVKGFQVAPAELEELLRGHPTVQDAAVIGIPDEKHGESPKAFVVLKKGSNTSAEDISKYVAEKVVNYKQLTGGVVFLESIPKTASGKILRKDLRNY
ncbi:PREDICTED: 4-coumarate--CoA ligase 1-like [Nicrophorus vespilloides]|uniref:4-coumarate--CoA ligase 1-like n=1 Tax=Nicrophorus vespilloides TaxID=110193 RepID=A0ABM1NK98_NICVS|nr:PREDICTED: 4-coumarate--CoA ligase 1-like [Nicrophorus vespilloides]